MTPRDAALAVTARAHDTDDAALLLDALGLVVDGRLAWPDPGVLPIPRIRNIARSGRTGGTRL